MGTLLSLPTDRYKTIELTPQKRKAETISILVKQFETLARTSPVLVMLEDAHWIDHSTRELFDAVTDEVARMRVLVVVTHRPEFDSLWTIKGHVTQLMLNRLGRRDVNSLVQCVAGDTVMPEEMVQQIHQKTRTLAQEGLDICEELGFPPWLPGVAQLRDWALVVEQADADAFARMGERISPELVAGQLLPGNVIFLIEACIRLGERAQGIAAVVTGLKLAEVLGQRWSFAELHRLHAVLLVLGSVNNPNEVKSTLQLSLELARQQHAKSIELRSATALARLHLQEDDTEVALRLLVPVYNAFNEGFDTPDLKEAKALLEELAGRLANNRNGLGPAY